MSVFDQRFGLCRTGHALSREAAALAVFRSVQTFLSKTRKLALQALFRSWAWELCANIERTQFRAQKKGEEIMLGLIAAVLIICWLLGLFAFHVTSGLIHIVLIVGLILLVLHFVSGRRVSV